MAERGAIFSSVEAVFDVTVSKIIPGSHPNHSYITSKHSQNVLGLPPRQAGWFERMLGAGTPRWLVGMFVQTNKETLATEPHDPQNEAFLVAAGVVLRAEDMQV